jgi:hypothetical protein
MWRLWLYEKRLHKIVLHGVGGKRSVDRWSGSTAALVRCMGTNTAGGGSGQEG